MNIKESKEGGITVELDDSEVALFAKMGLEHAIKDHLMKIGGPKYTAEFGKLGPTWDDDDEERINIIGQNGNDGDHYVDYGAGPVVVQHEMVMDNPTDEEKAKNLEEYHRRLEEDDVYI